MLKVQKRPSTPLTRRPLTAHSFAEWLLLGRRSGGQSARHNYSARWLNSQLLTSPRNYLTTSIPTILTTSLQQMVMLGGEEEGNSIQKMLAAATTLTPDFAAEMLGVREVFQVRKINCSCQLVVPDNL